MKMRHPIFRLALVAGLLTFAVYLPSLGNGFVTWDDEQAIVENLRIRSMDSAFFRWAFTDLSFSLWQPLAWVSHALDYAVWGLNPAGHHLTGILLHAANAFLVVFAAASLVEAGRWSPGQAGGQPSFPTKTALIAAAASGVLFGIHPQHVESAVWLTGRTDLLCTFFSLLSLLAYLRHAKEAAAGTGARPLPVFGLDRSYFLSFFLFLCALASKPSAVTLFVVFAILDWYPLRRFGSPASAARALAEKIPFLLAAVVVTLVTMKALDAAAITARAAGVPVMTRIALAFPAVSLSVTKMVFPVNLLPLYPHPADASLFSQEGLFAFVFVAGMTVLSLSAARQRPAAAAAWAAFLVLLLPSLAASGFRKAFAADRYVYLPSVGMMLLAGFGVAMLADRLSRGGRESRPFRAIALAAGGVLVIVLAALTLAQIAVWKSSLDLWDHVIAREPSRIPTAYHDRGLVHKRAGEPGKAISDYSMAINLNATYTDAYKNRGISYRDAGMLEKALGDFDAAIAISPADAMSYSNRGSILAEIGRPDQAIEDFNRAIELEPRAAALYYNRGLLFDRTGRPGLAIEDYTAALSLDPSIYPAYNKRASLLKEAGRSAEAIADYTQALQLRPDDAGPYMKRGELYQATGNRELGLRDYRAACERGIAEGCGAAVRIGKEAGTRKPQAMRSR